MQGFWYQQLQTCFFFLFIVFFFFFFYFMMSERLIHFHVEWHLNGCTCMCLFYDLHCLEQDEKWRYFRMRRVAFYCPLGPGSPLTSSEPAKPTGPTFSARALTWGEQTGKKKNEPGTTKGMLDRSVTSFQTGVGYLFYFFPIFTWWCQLTGG